MTELLNQLKLNLVDLISRIPIKENILWAGGIILCILILATLINKILTLSFPKKDFEQIRLRIRSWWFMAGIFLLAISINIIISLIFISLLCFLAFKEYLSIIPTRRADRRVLFWAYLSIPIQFFWIYINWYGMFIVFIPVFILLFLPALMVAIGETEGFLKAIGTLHWGLMTMVFGISHMAYLLVLPESVNPAGGNGGLVLFLICLTQGNDVLQFLSGKLFGKHKVVPTVSPNKTVEGLLGGLILTTLSAYLIAPFLTPFNWWQSILIGFLISFTGFVGDVVISAIKRDLKIKDSSNIIPGHGGILDRIDSLTYTAPIFFHYTYYLYY